MDEENGGVIALVDLSQVIESGLHFTQNIKQQLQDKDTIIELCARSIVLEYFIAHFYDVQLG